MTDLAPLTTLGVGGSADRFFAIRRREEIVATYAVAGLRDEPVTLLGGGSNVVIADTGLRGTVVQITGGATGARRVGDDAIEWTVDAGVAWDDFVATTIAAGATGVELLSGIPGTVGAAPVQNIAAYGQQVCDAITAVGIYDRSSGQLGEVPTDACDFAFRSSRFKDGDWADGVAITHVRMLLPLASASPPEPPTYGGLVAWFDRHGGDPTDPADRRRATLAVRAEKSMVIDPSDPMTRSVGSFFVNPQVPATLADELIARFASAGLDVTYLEGRRRVEPAATSIRVPAALLLRAADFRPGDRWGPVQLSDRHVLAIVAGDGASADDVWQLSHLIRRRVEAQTGVTLACEPRFLGEFDDVDTVSFEQRHAFTPGSADDPAWLR